MAENMQLLMSGIGTALMPVNFITAIVGLALGIIVGVLPGLGGANGVAILIPLTVAMDPVAGIILLASIYWGALYGGGITAILFNIPGEPWSVAVTFDGYPLANKGEPGKALVLSFLAHSVGAVIGVILLSFFAPIIAAFALMFGPSEVFAVMMLTFSAFVGLGGKDAVKSCVSIFIGFLLACVGMDIVTGEMRMTFGSIDLMAGFDFIIAVIGLFGLGEILLTVEEGLKIEGKAGKISLKDVKDGFVIICKEWKALVLGVGIGAWMGLKPGGATPASFMAYGFAKQGAKNKDEFGKGAYAGIIAPEAATHSAGTSAALPMITLGIPGSPTMAVIMGGLMIFGLIPGPMLFKEHATFVWAFIGSCWVGNILGLFIVMAFAPLFAAILRVRFAIIMPIIVYVCAIGAYAVNNRMIDIYYMIVFGVFGYLFKKLDYPIAPMVLALVLGGMAESALRQSLLMSGGNPGVLIGLKINEAGRLEISWLCLLIMIAAFIIFFWPSISGFLEKRKKASA
ncbi:MAG: tripartite tricarboxylate transporter permease [Syntrophorhabdaceae bacterium]|nr:tripartite tricarboxylate transporter permease [Syntrophorhabdaceae bacterium]